MSEEKRSSEIEEQYQRMKRDIERMQSHKELEDAPGSMREKLEQRLKHNYFIVAGGAWQHLWEKEDEPQVGFHAVEKLRSSMVPSQEDLKDSIRPELLKRFRSEIVVMQPMAKEDYEHVIEEMYSQLPKRFQDVFYNLAYKDVDKAVIEKTGMRYFEEILSATMSHRLLQEYPHPTTETITTDPF